MESERSEEDTRGHEQRDNEQSDRHMDRVKLGVAFLVGAVAANVIGFRYSRWAVGKEVHRAWENQQSQERIFLHEQGRKLWQRNSEEWKQEPSVASWSAKGRQDSATAKEAAAEKERRRRQQRVDAAFEADQRARETVFQAHERMRGPFGSARTSTSSFRVFVDDRVEMDPRKAQEIFEAMRRDFAGFGVHWTSTSQRSSASSEEFARWMEELLRDSRESPFGQSGFAHPQARPAGSKDYYATLGVQQSASEKEIKDAFRSQAKKWHPDSYQGSNPEFAARKFREISTAYEVLKDPEKRRRHDLGIY
uniref:J domain-containing protein n=1 Tax=Compsopogon caeruleus TaxID=31354 RepID=A0A7S1TE84_9RHOD|mmetsp:Transcript_18593/g.39061  ORF Transcript_18593/g.39061 Transcript_18593/m.39061 type:complete len:307 (+) Transcript_18593:84-1004(+)|eukprot:CAMPEP_0184683492 /NCGR_PEP_ID=MMETSP0312-20130426/11556_1 /TAXON_ID=31354 /ORGANISM="Compsopogon coeruleus, Strain SAG 36.94" /LENGTH=306 /DNA_ID=CAMNT_0027135899 /DNA_START=71 /DNA_END=991 /DNA_ORIENTATION=-